MTDTKPVMTLPDGSEYIGISRDRLDQLLAAEEELEDLLAALEGREALARDGGIPADVARWISDGAHPIKAWRDHHGLTQAQLAEKAGMTQAAIARLESAKVGAGRAGTLDRLAKALGAPRWTLEDVPEAQPQSDPIAAKTFGTDQFAGAIKVSGALINEVKLDNPFKSTALAKNKAARPKSRRRKKA